MTDYFIRGQSPPPILQMKPGTPAAMVETLTYILNKYQVSAEMRSPIDLADVGRDDLANLFAELGFKVGAEIGVEQGLYSEVLAKANPAAKLFCIDAWCAYKNYRDHVSQDKIDGFYDASKARLASYNCTLLRAFSMDAVRDFADESLDYVYIDGNHKLDFVINDIIEWSKKVKPQ